MAYVDVNISGHREGEPERDWRYWTFKKEIIVVSPAANAELNINFLNSAVTQIHFTVPDLDDTDTAELLIHDLDDNVLYASGEKAEQATHVINVERSLCGELTLRIECSGAQAADRTFVVKMYGYHG